MNIKKFDALDYEKICSWWERHGWPSIPLDFLPKTGIIVDDCAAGFIYSTDSSVCLLEFVVVDPRIEKTKRRLALDCLLCEVEKIAKNQGFKIIFTSVSHKGLIERYKTNGYSVSDNNMTNLIKVL